MPMFFLLLCCLHQAMEIAIPFLCHKRITLPGWGGRQLGPSPEEPVFVIP
jgi:hypothetical protein